MSLLACSTSFCPLPLSPPELVERFQGLCRGLPIDAMALDGRLETSLQEAILGQGRALGISCTEIAHPFGARPGGLRPAMPTSLDKDEQRTAGRQILTTCELAQEHGVPRVLLGPFPLGLPVGVGTLARAFTVGEELDLEAVVATRQEPAQKALDALCRVLDPLLHRIDGMGELVLLTPSSWPHQVPSALEVMWLREVFRGGALGVCHAVDQAHVAWRLGTDVLSGGEWHRSRTKTDASVIWLADACGLMGMLPPGTGEVDWSEALAGLGTPASMVFTIRADVDVSAEELADGVRLLVGA